MMRKLIWALMLGVAGLTMVGAQPCLAITAAAAAEKPVYKDAAAPVEARVNDLLARMTPEEKIAEIMTVWDAKAEIRSGQIFGQIPQWHRPVCKAVGCQRPRLSPRSKGAGRAWHRAAGQCIAKTCHD
jgi:hypothetical protein